MVQRAQRKTKKLSVKEALAIYQNDADTLTKDIYAIKFINFFFFISAAPQEDTVACPNTRYYVCPAGTTCVFEYGRYR